MPYAHLTATQPSRHWTAHLRVPVLGYRAVRALTLSALVALLAVIGLYTNHLIELEKQAVVEQAYTFNGSLVAADEGRMSKTIEAFDKAMLLIRRDYLKSKKTYRGEDVAQLLAAMQLDETNLRRVVVIDANGNVVVSTDSELNALSRPLNVADRAYFKFNQNATTDEVHVAVPAKSLIDDRWVVVLTRRMVNADGSFAGLVAFSLDPELFATPYQNSFVGVNSSRAVIGLDGITRVRRNGSTIQYGGDIRNSQVFNEIQKAPAGNYTARAASDGVLRAVSYRVIEPLKLVVISATSLDDLMLTLQPKIRTYVSTALAVSAIASVLTLMLLASMKQQFIARGRLRTSVKRMNALFNNTPVLSVVTEFAHGVEVLRDCNVAFCNALGYSKQELIGKPVSELVDVQPNAEAGLKELMPLGRLATQLTPTRLVCKSGARLPTVAHAAAIDAEEGTNRDADVDVHADGDSDTDTAHTGRRLTFLDISSNEQIRLALEQSQTNFKVLIESIPQLVTMYDLKGNITWVNQRLLDYIGLIKPADATDADFNWVRYAIHEADAGQAAAIRQLAFESGVGWESQEIRFLGKSGEYRWFASYATPVVGADGSIEFWVGTQVDIHDRKMAEQRMLALQKMESIGQLTGGLAHDFNNLLGIIIGSLDMLAEDCTNDKARKRIGVALGAAERGADLVKSLLALASQQKLSPKVVELNTLIQDSAPLLKHALGVRVSLDVKTCPEPVRVEIDAAALESVLLNLAVNARDAMPTGGHLTVTLQRLTAQPSSAESQAGLALISVTDDGCGMPPEVIAQSMEPFFTTKEQGKGTGLGLAMVAGFVKQSKGEVKITSAPGAGTTVEVYLPLLPHTPANSAPNSGFVELKNHTEHILVVDDQADIAALVSDWVTSEGYTSTVVGSADSALAVLHNTAVDILITDIMMPGTLDGLALAALVQARYPMVKILLVSGYSKATVATQDEIPWPLLIKPFRKPELLKSIHALVSADDSGYYAANI